MKFVELCIDYDYKNIFRYCIRHMTLEEECYVKQCVIRCDSFEFFKITNNILCMINSDIFKLAVKYGNIDVMDIMWDAGYRYDRLMWLDIYWRGGKILQWFNERYSK